MKSRLALPAIIVPTCAAVFFVRRYALLTGSPFLRGADAYYYALQIRSLAETGALKMADAAPLLPLMASTARLGLGYERAIILWSLLAQLVFGLNLLLAFRVIRGHEADWSRAWLPFAWALLSPTLAFTCLEFPKYALALAFLPLWPLGLVRRRWWPVSLAALLFACANHRALVGLAGLTVLGLAAAAIVRRRVKPRHLLLGAIGLAGLGLAGILCGRDYFSLADLRRIDLHGLQPGLWTFLARPAIPPALKVEALSSLALAAWWWISAKGRDPAAAVLRAIGLLALLVLIPLGSQEVMGLPERLVLLLPVLALALWTLADVKEPVLGREPVVYRVIPAIAASVLLVLVALLPQTHLDLAHPARLDPDYALYDRVTSELAPRRIPMLIAHRGLNFYYKYRTLRDSFPYEPEPHWPKEGIWRAAYGITPSEWAYYLPQDCLWGSGKLVDLPGPYNLIREDCWDIFRRGVAGSLDEELRDRVWSLWLNPSQGRPEFLYERVDPEDGGPFSARPGGGDFSEALGGRAWSGR